jgi:hypothetical protein
MACLIRSNTSAFLVMNSVDSSLSSRCGSSTTAAGFGVGMSIEGFYSTTCLLGSNSGTGGRTGMFAGGYGTPFGSNLSADALEVSSTTSGFGYSIFFSGTFAFGGVGHFSGIIFLNSFLSSVKFIT